MAKYGTKRYGSGVRYGVTSVISVYYQSNIVAKSIDYGKIKIDWDPVTPDPSDRVPTHWALVRSYSGSLDNPYDGTILIGGAYSTISTTYTDTIIDKEDLEVCYSLWLFNGVAWKFCGSSYTILVGAKDSLVKISNWLPKAWLNPVDRVGEGLSTYNDNTLTTILGVFAFMYDRFRVEGTLLANQFNSFYTPSKLLDYKGTSLGYQYEAALGDTYNRSISAVGNVVNSYKGTTAGLIIYTNGLVHWNSTPIVGHNLLLDYNDSSFEESLGNWGVSSGTFTATTYALASISVPAPFVDISYPPRTVGLAKLVTAATTPITMSLPKSGNSVLLTGVPIKQNTRYVFSGWARHVTASATVSAVITWYDQFGTSLGSTSAGTSLTTTTSFAEFTSSSDSGRNGKLSPLNAKFAKVTLTLTPSSSASNTLYFDMFQFSEAEKSFLFEDARKVYLTLKGQKENYIYNPEFEYGYGSWTAINSTITPDSTTTAGILHGTKSLKLTSTANGTAAIVSDWVAMDPGQSILVSASILGSAARTARIRVEFSNQSTTEQQTSILTDVDGQYYPLTNYYEDSDPITLSTTTSNTAYTFAVTPPFTQDAGNPLAKITIYITDNVAGDSYWIDGVLLEESSTLLPFFSGDGGANITNPLTQPYQASEDSMWEIKELYNYMSNSGFDINTTDWTAGSGTLTRVTLDGSGIGPKYGAYFGKLTYSSTGSVTGTAYLPSAALGGEDLTISAWVRKAVATYTIGTDSFTIPSAEASSWNRIHTSIQLTAGQTTVPFTISVTNTAGSTSTICHIDGVVVNYGRVVTTYVDPSAAGTFVLVNPLNSAKTIWASKTSSVGGGKSNYFYNYSAKLKRLKDTINKYMPIASTWAITPGTDSGVYEDLPGAKIPSSSFEKDLNGWVSVNSTLARKVAAGTFLNDITTHGQGYCTVTTAGSSGNKPFGIKTGKVYIIADAGYYSSVAIRPKNSNSLGNYSLRVDYYDINNAAIVVYLDNLTGYKTTNSKDSAGNNNAVVTDAARTKTVAITHTDRWAYLGNSFPVSTITGAAYAIINVTFSPTTYVSGQAFDIDRVVFRE